MKTRKVSIALLSLALSSGAAVLAHAQEGPPPPPPPPYGAQGPDQDRDRDHDRGPDQGDPGRHAGFRDGFENGRKDFNDHHTFVPEKAFRRNGRPKYHDAFGDDHRYMHSYHDAFIRGYDRGYHGGDPDEGH